MEDLNEIQPEDVDPDADLLMSEAEGRAIREGWDEYNFDEETEKVAKKRGLVVVYPAPNEVQIDLDSEEEFYAFKRNLELFDIGQSACRIAPSASGLPCRHVTIKFEEEKSFTEPERIALQMALGSDPVRERLNFLRHWNGLKNPTRLFEKP